MSEPKDFILLKWGTLKEWRIETPAAAALVEEYERLGFSMSAAAQEDTPEQKDILCRMIDASDVETVKLDWTGEDISKQAAKDYILNYGKPRVAPPSVGSDR